MFILPGVCFLDTDLVLFSPLPRGVTSTAGSAAGLDIWLLVVGVVDLLFADEEFLICLDPKPFICFGVGNRMKSIICQCAMRISTV